MISFAVLNSLVSDVKRIFACKLSDDFSGFVDTCETGKRNRAGALVLGNGRIELLSAMLVLQYCIIHGRTISKIQYCSQAKPAEFGHLTPE